MIKSRPANYTGGFIRRRRAGSAATLFCAAVSLAVAGLAGCGGSSNTSTSTPTQGLPVAPTPTLTNSYVGTQSPGLWSYTIDDTQQAYSYQAITYPSTQNVPTAGKFLSLEGFMTLSDSVSNPAGYSLEIPSRAALLRPGDDTKNLVAAVQQLTCFPLGGNVKFQFVGLPANTANGGAVAGGLTGYGTIVASTNADGSSWQFGGQAWHGLPPSLNTPGSLGGGYPVSFAGTCSVKNGQASIAVPAINSTGINQYPTPATTFEISPSGFLIEDQSNNTPYFYGSMFGIVQPAAPLVTANIAAGKYLGFMVTSSTSVLAQPIGFGQVVAGAGTSLTGGTWPSDDLTQLQNSDTVIDLGTQDSQNNGVYPTASITYPDPTYACSGYTASYGAQSGFDANGLPTCKFPAVAVVGNPENKFAIFLSAGGLDGSVSIYLFQQ